MSYVSAPADVLCVADGEVEGRMAVCTTADGNYLPETLRGRRQAEENGFGLEGDLGLRIPESSLRKHDRPVAVVGLPVGGNYFHWMLEAVGRYLLGSRVVPDDVDVVTQRLSTTERDALKLAGVAPKRIVELEPGERIRSPRVYVAPRGLSGASSIRPAAVQAIRGLAVEPKIDPPQRIFISRASARRRRIRNEAEVSDLLAQFGFRTVRTESMTVAAQADLFARAGAVISLHGAGLTNLAFCPGGSYVLELQPPALDDARTVLFWNIAAIRGLEYAQLVCAEASGQHDVSPSARDIVVDTAVLGELLLGRFGLS